MWTIMTPLSGVGLYSDILPFVWRGKEDSHTCVDMYALAVACEGERQHSLGKFIKLARVTPRKALQVPRLQTVWEDREKGLLLLMIG